MTPLSRPFARAALALLLSAAGLAQAEGFYAGASLGAPHYDTSVDGVRGDEGGVAAKLYGGYALSPNFSLEAGAARFGHMRDDSGKASGDAGFLDAVGRFEFAPQWSLIARAGYAHGRFDSPAGKDSTDGYKLGAGLQYDLTQQVSLVGEYERYHFGNPFDAKVDVGQFTAGVQVAF